MKKVSIITYHRVYNYGAALQAYATIKCFEKIGCEAYVIDYIPRKVRDYGSLRQTYYESGLFYKNPVKRLLSALVKMPSYKKQREIFDPFYKSYLPMTKKYYSKEELEKDPPQCDIFCTGSDQVWNNTYSKGFDFTYFLSFVKDTPKIAFSASFGRKVFSKSELMQMQPYLSEYKAISVREKSGLDLLDNVPVAIKEQTLDPTLLLNKDAWSEFITEVPYEKYILVYQLHGESPVEEYANILSQRMGLKVVKIVTMLHKRSKEGISVMMPSVPMFLSLIWHADLIVTDSFHGTAFSINFNKKFVCVSPGRTGERIKSILALTGVEDRLVSSNEDLNMIFSRDIDYNRVNNLLENSREKSISYLSKAIYLN